MPFLKIQRKNTNLQRKNECYKYEIPWLLFIIYLYCRNNEKNSCTSVWPDSLSKELLLGTIAASNFYSCNISLNALAIATDNIWIILHSNNINFYFILWFIFWNSLSFFLFSPLFICSYLCAVKIECKWRVKAAWKSTFNLTFIFIFHVFLNLILSLERPVCGTREDGGFGVFILQKWSKWSERKWKKNWNIICNICIVLQNMQVWTIQ